MLCFVGLLAGCGFQPRASLAVATELGPVVVATADPYSPLGRDLATALERAGATPAATGEAAATLQVLSESMRTRPLTFASGASVREYQAIYRVRFELRGADGGVRVPAQDVELTREYTYDAQGSIGTPAEERLLQEELRRDMVAAVMRRLDVALRTD